VFANIFTIGWLLRALPKATRRSQLLKPGPRFAIEFRHGAGEGTWFVVDREMKTPDGTLTIAASFSTGHFPDAERRAREERDLLNSVYDVKGWREVK
jgi:hypothetical protein